MKIFLIPFFLVICYSQITAQIVENKKWCLSVCNITGDEKANTDTIFAQCANDSIQKKLEQVGVLKFPLRVGIIQQQTTKLEVDEVEINRAIAKLNKSFEGTDLVFYLAKVDIIKSAISMEELPRDTYQSYFDFSGRYDLTDTISVFIFDHQEDFCTQTETTLSCGRTGGFSFILSNATNNLVLSRFDFNNSKIVAHEFGHFFGLYHTSEKDQYGSDGFDADDCQKIGDRICDTPPDPGSNYEVYVNYDTCELLRLKSETGKDYRPIIQNYMSYYKPCYMKAYSFTNGQKTVMKTAGNAPLRKRFSRK